MGLRLLSFLKNNILFITCSLLLSMFALLAAAFLFKKLDERFFVDYKESLAFGIKLFELILVLVAALLAYSRFFQGHLFLSKLNVQIFHKIVLLSNNKSFHFFEIELNNVGDYTILNPRVKASVSYIPALKEPELIIIRSGMARIDESMGHVNHVVRAKTVSSLDFSLHVDDADIKALKIEVVIEHKKRIWKKIILVENRSS